MYDAPDVWALSIAALQFILFCQYYYTKLLSSIALCFSLLYGIVSFVIIPFDFFYSAAAFHVTIHAVQGTLWLWLYFKRRPPRKRKLNRIRSKITALASGRLAVVPT